VRSIFEGFPIAAHKQRRCRRLIYEVNGLPSIELKYHYPQVADDRELLGKLEAQERFCLEAADLIITPSPVTAAELRRRGAAAERLEVIPNGVDEERFSYHEPSYRGDRALRLLYVGTMTSWQGVHHALEALRLLLRDHPAELSLVGPARARQRRELAERAAKLGIERQVRYLGAASQAALLEHYRWADVALVPLPPNDRNLVQGCCPLKLIEAMAAGVPVVASDLPVIRALADPEQQALLVRPGSGKAIKDGLLRLVADPLLGRRLAASARRRVEQELSWRHAGERLVACYRRLA
jgi:glycosyltransferase involved in cell wall biosynthesis